MLHFGLYEQIINQQLEKEITSATDVILKTEPIDQAEAAKILSKYVADVVEVCLNHIRDNGGDVRNQIFLVNKVVTAMQEELAERDFDRFAVAKQAKQLIAFFENRNSVSSIEERVDMIRPVTSIAQSSLFTGAIHEPQMYSELKKEIASSNRIDMLVSFIKWSGLRLILDEIKAFTMNGGMLRVITTSYMGATDIKAVEELSRLTNTRIKISYDTKRTRLHAKAYVFYRDTGFSTAYVGSSNLSNAAISSGLEWNVKVARKDLPETIDKIAATFESYWNSNEFEFYSDDQKPRLVYALREEKYYDASQPYGYVLDISPYPYQQEILDRLEAEREIRGHFRNLIVAATGTGKTVISALDYKRFCRQNAGKHNRLLFIAHREEILRQSLSTFRAVLKDQNFGEMFVGNTRPDGIDHLFMSIQTFNSQDFASKTTPDFYDYIVVDEFHHAAAPSYNSLLEHYQPQILLGLTATPERMDGKSILPFFDNRIAAEIRLPEAIERKLLSPFQYFGVTDVVDLNQLRWKVGGYDKGELSQIYALSGVVAERRAELIISSFQKYVTSVEDVKGLGFCVSIEHARFMSEQFSRAGIPSLSLFGTSPDEDRHCAKERLVSGQIRFIFVVDIYNEGVDIPEVNTVLFLRPTESLTIFLQQLGRGLRLAEGKECLTVLDFIGQANRKYNFEEKFAALLSNSSRSVTREIKEGFITAPKGCYIQLEKKAAKYILENIRSSFGNSSGLISRIAAFEEDTGLQLSLPTFLEHYHLSPLSIYKFSSFSRLCARADVVRDFSEPLEEVITKALPRFAMIDSHRLIRFFLRILKDDLYGFSETEEKMLQMFQFTMWQKSLDECGIHSFSDAILMVRDNPILCAELIALLEYNFNQIDFVDESIDLGFPCPLDLHCTYTRDQILVALDFLRPSTIREGVKWLPEKNLDILFVTLNKSDKDYSPTTMYRDYSISDLLFHWQSQSTTSENSPTGYRYVNHKSDGSHILLFVREFKTDPVSGLAQPYTNLGLVEYVKHEGSRPMNITWKLLRAIPAKFLKKTNKLIVG